VADFVVKFSGYALAGKALKQFGNTDIHLNNSYFLLLLFLEMRVFSTKIQKKHCFA
jgi:hypothetical protein